MARTRPGTGRRGSIRRLHPYQRTQNPPHGNPQTFSSASYDRGHRQTSTSYHHSESLATCVKEEDRTADWAADGDETEVDETEGDETEGDETEGDEIETDGDTISQPDEESIDEKHSTRAADRQPSESGGQGNLHRQPALVGVVAGQYVLLSTVEGIVAARRAMEDAVYALAAHLRKEDDMTSEESFTGFHLDSAKNLTELFLSVRSDFYMYRCRVQALKSEQGLRGSGLED
ncbi:hypothetical protein ACEPPN_000378 [Leptodophora sp. 'Broadleaf-Isolate-01']